MKRNRLLFVLLFLLLMPLILKSQELAVFNQDTYGDIKIEWIILL